jgi:hypothetical protein
VRISFWAARGRSTPLRIVNGPLMKANGVEIRLQFFYRRDFNLPTRFSERPLRPTNFGAPLPLRPCGAVRAGRRVARAPLASPARAPGARPTRLWNVLISSNHSDAMSINGGDDSDMMSIVRRDSNASLSSLSSHFFSSGSACSSGTGNTSPSTDSGARGSSLPKVPNRQGDAY